MSYRISQWLDTSKKSMAQENARILYGVQFMCEGRYWVHLHDGGEPCIFETIEEAEIFIDLLILQDRERS